MPPLLADAEAIFRIVIGHAIDETRQNFLI